MATSWPSPTLFLKVRLTFLIYSPRQRSQILYALHWMLPLLTSFFINFNLEGCGENQRRWNTQNKWCPSHTWCSTKLFYFSLGTWEPKWSLFALSHRHIMLPDFFLFFACSYSSILLKNFKTTLFLFIFYWNRVALQCYQAGTWVGMAWETKIDTYTLLILCIKQRTTV